MPRTLDPMSLSAVLARHAADLSALQDRHSADLSGMVMAHAAEIVALGQRTDAAGKAPTESATATDAPAKVVAAPAVAGAKGRS